MQNGDLDLESYIEIRSDLGPLPSHTELVTRFATDIKNGLAFSIDANGYQFLERQFQASVGIEGNYYPMVYASFIKDNLAQLSLIGERSHGASSLTSGELEVMLHRNPDMGDNFGPGLTDTTEVYPTIRVLVDKASAMTQVHRQSYRLNFPVSVFSAPTASPSVWRTAYVTNVQFLKNSLPANVHLQCLSALDTSSTKAILRLTHVFANGEDPVLSQPVTINFTDLFAQNFAIKTLVETTLSANKVLVNPSPLTIQISPSEIRTFVVEFSG